MIDSFIVPALWFFGLILLVPLVLGTLVSVIWYPKSRRSIGISMGVVWTAIALSAALILYKGVQPAYPWLPELW